MIYLEHTFDQFPKYQMKILFPDFNAKVRRKDILKQTVGNESWHKTSNDNGIRLVYFATSEYLVVSSSLFPLRKIHKYTWTSPDGKTYIQIDRILLPRQQTDRRQQSTILDVQAFRQTDCDTNHYLVVARHREKLLVSKQATQKFVMHRFYLKKLNDAKIKEQHQVKISNRFAASENLDDNVDINRGWENITENINISVKASVGHYDLKQQKPCFDKERSKLFNRREAGKVAGVAEYKPNEW
jgi:hypothetical protein